MHILAKLQMVQVSFLVLMMFENCSKCLISSCRPNLLGSAELSGLRSVRFGGSAEPRSSVNRTITEPNHYKSYYKDAIFK